MYILPYSKSLEDKDATFLFASISFCLMSMGRLEESIFFREKDIALSEIIKDWDGVGRSCENLINSLIPIGKLAECMAPARNALDFSSRHDNWFRKRSAHSFMAVTLHKQGRLYEALSEFHIAEEIQIESTPNDKFLHWYSGATYCALLLDMTCRNVDVEKILLRGFYGLEFAKEKEHSLSIALDNLTIARCVSYLNTKNCNKTAINEVKFPEYQLSTKLSENEFFDLSLEYIEKSTFILYLPEILIFRASYYKNKYDFPLSYGALNNAQIVIGNFRLRLYATDAALLSGHLSLDCKENPPEEMDDELTLGPNCAPREDYIGRAQAHHKRAAQLIESTGYHLRDPELTLLEARIDFYRKQDPRPALDKSRKRLEEMGYWGLLPEWERVAAECGY